MAFGPLHEHTPGRMPANFEDHSSFFFKPLNQAAEVSENDGGGGAEFVSSPPLEAQHILRDAPRDR